MSKGYKLADGSLSTDYEVGDKFFVVRGGTRDTLNSISLYNDDRSPCPYFKKSGKILYIHWEDLEYKGIPRTRKQEDVKVKPPTEKEKYIIVRSYTSGNTRISILDYLQEQVNAKIKDGYATTGEITMMDGVIIQPMVLQEGSIIE